MEKTEQKRQREDDDRETDGAKEERQNDRKETEKDDEDNAFYRTVLKLWNQSYQNASTLSNKVQRVRKNKTHPKTARTQLELETQEIQTHSYMTYFDSREPQ